MDTLISRSDIENLLRKYDMPLVEDDYSNIIHWNINGWKSPMELLSKSFGMPYHIALLHIPIDMEGLYDPIRVKVAEMLLALKARKGEQTTIIFDKAIDVGGKSMPVRQTFELSSQPFNDGLILLCECFLLRQQQEKEFRPLEKEELENIISREKHLLATDYSEAEAVGERITHLQDKFRRIRLFDGWKERKVFSFFYDWCLLQGVNGIGERGDGFSGVVGKEKADWVKYRIKAYNAYCDRMHKERTNDSEQSERDKLLNAIWERIWQSRRNGLEIKKGE